MTPIEEKKRKERAARNEGPTEIPFTVVSSFLDNFKFHDNTRKDFEICQALEGQKYRSMQYLINQAQGMIASPILQKRFIRMIKGLRGHYDYKNTFETNP